METLKNNEFQYETGFVRGFEAAQPKWISVEERLPEAKTAVLAYGQRHVFNGKEIEGFPMAHVAYTRGWEEGWFSWDSDHYIDVTHWMPLPSTEGLNAT